MGTPPNGSPLTNSTRFERARSVTMEDPFCPAPLSTNRTFLANPHIPGPMACVRILWMALHLSIFLH